MLVVTFTAPRTVDVTDVPQAPLRPGQVRVRTLTSGISAGTELTAYRGTNPYLTSTWDPTSRLFTGSHPQTPSYPLAGWGYSEVGRVVEVAEPATQSPHPDDVQVGDVVWGIWGHVSEGVLDAERLRGHQLPAGLDPLAGSFVRVGAIALNAVLAADAGLGDTVVIVGQGVIGLLATAFAKQSGATVIAVEGIAGRRDLARAWGADEVFAPSAGVASAIRDLTRGRGADVAIDLSGAYPALHEATRLVGADGRVVAAGFYQGAASALRLGEEFHHNRVEIIASQIGAVPLRKRARWDVPRLQDTVVQLLAKGTPDVTELVSHRFAVRDAAQAYTLLDTDAPSAVQVVLDFPEEVAA
jgi:2-desacetyl-2-hydroxyethyl bacteriochlorophyllide A dehydrogenase